MAYRFNPPSVEDATRFLARVPYRERLPMGRMHWPSGLFQTPARSLNEVYIGLFGTTKQTPAVHVPTLVAWVDEVVGDHELAATLAGCECNSYMHHCDELREILGARLAQLRAIAGVPVAAAQADISGGS